MKRYLILLMLLATACKTAPPVVTPQPPPAPIRVAATVLDPDRHPIEDLNCTLIPDDSPAVDCDYSSQLQAVFMVPANRLGWGARLIFRADGFITVDKRILVARDLDEITLYPDAVNLPRLVPVGQYLQQDNGNRFTVIEATDFNLLARFVRGEDITPVLQQRAEVGFNTLRVFTAFDICPTGAGCQPIGSLKPLQQLDMYAKLPAFLKLLSRYGLYAELVGFTGPYDSTLPTDADKIAHWENLAAAVKDSTNVMLELVNEGTHPANRDIPFAQLQCPAGILTSRGSGQQDETPIMPLCNYATYRPGAGPEWMRKAAHNGMEDVADKFNIPTVANETTRFPDNDSNAAHAFDTAAGMALLSAGGTFHSVSGKNSVLWQGLELELARAWAAGAKSIPLACQPQPYRRTVDDAFLRVYHRGTDPACTVKIRY